jgi:benzoyl-CoA 2,3-dioxygenase component B
MLTEEAFHLFVGETGMERIIRRSAELEALDPDGDVRRQGGIDFDTIQRSINYWFSLLPRPVRRRDLEQRGELLRRRPQGPLQGGRALRRPLRARRSRTRCRWSRAAASSPARSRCARAMNEVLRDDYIADCERALRKWNIPRRDGPRLAAPG